MIYHADITCRGMQLTLIVTCKQIADFGMARDVTDDTYYITKGGKIPVKWTAPEVNIIDVLHS